MSRCTTTLPRLKRSADAAGGAREGTGSGLARRRRDRPPLLHAGGRRILPFDVFVPSTWNGKSALPLVFILHGNSRDQDFYFYCDGRIIPKTAAKHGYMVVAPLRAALRMAATTTSRTRAADGGACGRQRCGVGAADGGPGGRGFGGVNGSVTPALVRSEWSEQDAMHVLELVRRSIR